MKRVISTFSIAILIASSVLSFSSFATGNEAQGNQKQERKFEMPKNIVSGKITSITDKSVTISIVEMKKP